MTHLPRDGSPALGLSKELRGLAVFRETLLASLSPAQAAGMRALAQPLLELVSGHGVELPGVRSPTPTAHLSALAADLRFAAVYLHTLVATVTDWDPSSEETEQILSAAGAAQDLAAQLDEQAERWRSARKEQTR